MGSEGGLGRQANSCPSSMSGSPAAAHTTGTGEVPKKAMGTGVFMPMVGRSGRSKPSRRRNASTSCLAEPCSCSAPLQQHISDSTAGPMGQVPQQQQQQQFGSQASMLTVSVPQQGLLPGAAAAPSPRDTSMLGYPTAPVLLHPAGNNGSAAPMTSSCTQLPAASQYVIVTASQQQQAVQLPQQQQQQAVQLPQPQQVLPLPQQQAVLPLSQQQQLQLLQQQTAPCAVLSEVPSTFGSYRLNPVEACLPSSMSLPADPPLYFCNPAASTGLLGPVPSGGGLVAVPCSAGGMLLQPAAGSLATGSSLGAVVEAIPGLQLSTPVGLAPAPQLQLQLQQPLPAASRAMRGAARRCYSFTAADSSGTAGAGMGGMQAAVSLQPMPPMPCADASMMPQLAALSVAEQQSLLSALAAAESVGDPHFAAEQDELQHTINRLSTMKQLLQLKQQHKIQQCMLQLQQQQQEQALQQQLL